MNATSNFKFESRNLSAMFIGLALSAVLPAAVSNAVTITDTTTATTVFSDNYTQWTAGQSPSTVAAPDYTTQPFPIPQIGTYFGGAAASQPLSSAPIQVITSTAGSDPGAPAGDPSTYFRFYRDNDGPNGGVGTGANSNTNLVASLSTSVNGGDTLEFQTMINLNGTGAVDGQYRLNMDLYSNPDGTGSWIGISSDGAGHMQVYNGGWIDTSVAYTTGTWEKLTIDYTVGTGSLSITMGSSSQSGIAVPAMGSVGSVVIDNGSATPGSMYLASVPVPTPEPSALVLAAIGGLGVVGLRFWRRRSG